jgi:hypothetical protein
MTADTKLVAVRIAEICAIIVRMIVRPQSGLTFRPRALRHGEMIASVDRIAAGREKGNHLTVPWRGWFAIVGPPDQKKRPLGIGWLPAGPGFLRHAELERMPEDLHHGNIERECALEIAYADMNV